MTIACLHCGANNGPDPTPTPDDDTPIQRKERVQRLCLFYYQMLGPQTPTCRICLEVPEPDPTPTVEHLIIDWLEVRDGR
jgi:hypothetical protein